MIPMTDLSKNIKRLRQEKNLTPADLAELLHLPQETVISWERSDTIPAPEQLPAIAEALGTDVITLLYPVPEETKEPFRPGCGFVFASIFFCSWSQASGASSWAPSRSSPSAPP